MVVIVSRTALTADDEDHAEFVGGFRLKLS